MTGWQQQLNASTEAFLDQLLLRSGKTEHKGWLRYRSQAYGDLFRKAFFVLRDTWLVYYEGELMEDPGVRLLNVDKCRIIKFGRGFTLEDEQQRHTHFHCGVSDEIDTDNPVAPCDDEISRWIAAITAKGARLDDRSFSDPKTAKGAATAAPTYPWPKPSTNATAPNGSSPQPVRPHPSAATAAAGGSANAPAAPYPHISHTNGGKDYVPAEYDGGAEITEPAPLFKGEFLHSESEWRCWPSGPLPPNHVILGTEQNRETWSAAAGTTNLWIPFMPDEYARAGVGIVLKHAHQGVQVTEGKFSVQVADVPYGGGAYDAKQAGCLKVGDFVLSINGWSTAERQLHECAEKLMGAPGSEVRVCLGRLGTDPLSSRK